jgi:two-component system, NarL family, response regulator LiaR
MPPDHDRRARIVVADDHPSVLVAFVRMLELSCEVVGSVPNGRDALDAVTRLRPDILIVDLMMPDLDGLEICRQVKEHAPDTRVIIVTAFDDGHVRSVAFEKGAAAFVPKHSAAETLESTIQRVFSEKQGMEHPTTQREIEPPP